jgi:hypothetical protein
MKGMRDEGTGGFEMPTAFKGILLEMLVCRSLVLGSACQMSQKALSFAERYMN